MSGIPAPWFQQKATPSPPRISVDALTADEVDTITERLSRPTKAFLAKKALYWKQDGYTDRGRYDWSRMDLCEDCKKCTWTKDGTVKNTYKIRPNLIHYKH